MQPSIRYTLVVLLLTRCPCGLSTPHGIDEHYFLLCCYAAVLDRHYALWQRAGGAK